MSEGTRYQSTVAEWAQLINAPEEHDDDLDIYAKKKMDHNSMSNMYKEIPNEALDTLAQCTIFCQGCQQSIGY